MDVFRYIHSWVNNSTNTVFVTIPMIHIGTEQYYKEVSLIVNNLNLILEEGVPIKIDSEIGSYIKAAKKLGLVPQSQYLKIDEDVERINIDMDKSTFAGEFSKIPKEELRNLRLFKYILPFISKKKLLKFVYLCCSFPSDVKIKLIDPNNHYAYKHNKTPFDLLITNKRNDVIKTNLQRIINENKDREYRYDIGIIFGDEHMPAIYNQLKANGFKWHLEKEIFVF
jgi:hypothetical protein